ncbi:MAG: ATP-dependent helicase HrpB [Pirellulaceae bacterium]
MKPPQLPIDSHLPQIVQTLAEHNCLVLDAPPGTGKTTRVAPALLATLARNQRIALVQPRRIAARAAATRIASEQNCQVGERVGYQVRFDNRTTADTQLICMTPGILLRRLLVDPLLEQVAVVVLDEFHERSLEVDLLLGMLRRIQIEFRPELRSVIMSATLAADSLSAVLGAPPILRIPSPAYPVEIRYSRFQPTRFNGPRRQSPTQRIVEQSSTTIFEAASQHAGDILVFLPGVGEILQVARQIEVEAAKQQWDVLTLFGDMSPAEQDRVLLPSQRRKVILSTNVAETSLTIDGVCIVIDSGWARVQRTDTSIGLNKLELEPISQASATQRAGRAGRTQPGVCYRLWDAVTDRSRPAYLEPEVLRVDLTGAVLQLIAWGESEFGQFPWIDAPRSDALANAAKALELIEAVHNGRLTDLGKAILSLPVHPRLGRCLIEAHRRGIADSGAWAAALLSERDVFARHKASPRGFDKNQSGQTHGVSNGSSDLQDRVNCIGEFERTGRTQFAIGEIKPGAVKNLRRTADQFQRVLHDALGRPSTGNDNVERELTLSLLAAFPDRLAKRRSAGNSRGIMVGGRGVKLDPASCVRHAELFLCLDVDASGSEATVRQAAAIEFDWLPVDFLREADERFFNPTSGTVVARRRTYWLDLLLTETPIATPLDEETARTLAAEGAKIFERLLPPKDKELHSLVARMQWLSAAMPDCGLPSFAQESLAELLQGWCYSMRSLDELKTLPWKSLLQGTLDTNTRRLLDTAAPQKMTLPNGREVLLNYEVGKPPVLAARIQELFGWRETPRLAGGRVPLLLHLLAPNNRVQQITDDLQSFWRNTYPTVRKELRGRYPKHDWPETVGE